MLKSNLAILLTIAIATGCCHCPTPRPVITVNIGADDTYHPPPISCDIPSSAMLAVQRFPQEQTNTCWAASGQMAMHLFHKNVSQCDQIRHQAPLANCECKLCPDSAFLPADDCNNGGWPDFTAYGFDSSRIRGALRLDELKQEIACRKSPVLFAWKDELNVDKPSGHMMVAYGYSDDMILVMDPSPTCDLDANGVQGKLYNPQLITYEEYLYGNSPAGGHWDDIYAIQLGSGK